MSKPLELWKTLNRELLLSALPWFEVWREQVELPDGRIVPDFHKIDMQNVCSVVALTPTQDTLVFRQYKHGVGDISLGLPAGYMEQGEQPLQAAKRELLEETGYQSQDWFELGKFVRNGNQGCGFMHAFLALNATYFKEPINEDLEEQQLLLVSFPKLLDALFDGQIKIMNVALSISLANQYLSRLT